MTQIWILVLLALALVASAFPRGEADTSNIAMDLRSDTWEIWLFFGLCVAVLVTLYRWRFLRWVDEKAVPRGYPPDTTRHFTTRMHFELAAMVYCGTGLAIMALLFLFPRESVMLACAADSVFQTQICIREGNIISFTWLPLEENTQARTLPALALGFAAALGFLTLPRLEEFVRDALQKAALIPERARTLESTLLENFQRFQPDSQSVSAFLEDFNARGEGTRLYSADFDPETRDELYLEIYPRLEFILSRMASLGQDERVALGHGRFTDELLAMEGEMKNLRAGIRESAGAVRRLFGRDHGTLIAEAHARKGYEIPRGAPYSVTVLDDILRDIQAVHAPDDEDDADTAQQKRETVELTRFVSESLKSLRANCNAIHRRLIRMVVLMSLHSPQGPSHTLRYFGLSGRMDRMELEVLPRLMLGTFLLAVLAVLTVHQALGVDGKQWVTFLHALAMPAAGLFGGYLIATQAGRGLDAKASEIAHGSGYDWSQMSAAFVGGSLTTALAIVWLPTDGMPKPAGFSTAYFFIPVVAIYGCYLASVFLRQSAGLPLVRRKDWWRWPLLAAAMLFCSRFIATLAEHGDMTRAISHKQMIAGSSGISELEMTLGLAVVAAVGALIYVAMVAGMTALQDRKCRGRDAALERPKPRVVVFHSSRRAGDEPELHRVAAE